MSMRGPNNVERAVQTDPTLLLSAITEQKKCWELLVVRLRANGRNIVDQQLPTLLDVTCCLRLHTLLHFVGCCCVMLLGKLFSQQLPTFLLFRDRRQQQQQQRLGVPFTPKFRRLAVQSSV